MSLVKTFQHQLFAYEAGELDFDETLSLFQYIYETEAYKWLQVHIIVPLRFLSKRVTSLPLTTELKLVTSKVPYYCNHFFIMTTTTPDPITPNTERVLVRNTVTGFEQGIAQLLVCLPWSCRCIGILGYYSWCSR